MKEKESTVQGELLSLVKTTLTAFLITLILMSVLALLICFTPLPEEAVTPCVYILNYVSVFLAGLFSALRRKRRGFLTGAAAGGVYMALLFLLGFVLFGGIRFTKGVALQIFYCVICAMMGGIIGVNVRR